MGTSATSDGWGSITGAMYMQVTVVVLHDEEEDLRVTIVMTLLLSLHSDGKNTGA